MSAPSARKAIHASTFLAIGLAERPGLSHGPAPRSRRCRIASGVRPSACGAGIRDEGRSRRDPRDSPPFPRRTPRLLLLWRTLLALVLALSGRNTPAAETPEEQPRAPIRILVIELEGAARENSGGEPETPGTHRPTSVSVAQTFARLPELDAVAEVGRGGDPLTPDELRRADVVVLGRIERKGDPESLGEADIRALLEAARSGTGFVATAEAARSFPESRALGKLLGRKGLDRRSPDSDRAVAVRKQSHPITQCVTHFVHRGPLDVVKLAPEADALCEALVQPDEASPGEPEEARDTRLVPAFWTIRQGRGRVVATTLARGSGPSRELVDRVLARAVQWSARRPVTVLLPEDFRPIAATLGPRDEGLIAGRPPAKGFYRGRRIAPVMSYRGASWLLRPDRQTTEQPEKVLDSLGIRAGQEVADVGAGNGFFTLRLARRVGPEGKVYAVDIQKEMLELLERRLEDESIENVVSVLATESDPRLPRASVDLVLMVDVYHELSRPRQVMDHVRASLRDDGRLVLVEYRGEDPTVPIKPLHRMTVRQARAELEAVGFRLLEVKDFLPRQHILIFGKRGP